MVDRSPQVMGLAIDLHEAFVEVPAPLGHLAKLLRSTFLYFAGHHRTKAVPPETNRLVRDVDAAFVEKVFDVTKRERKSDVHHHRKTDDLRRRFEIAKRVAHPRRVEPNPITARLI